MNTCSHCGTEIKNVRKGITVHFCARKDCHNAYVRWKRNPIVAMYDDWELPKPTKEKVRKAELRGERIRTKLLSNWTKEAKQIGKELSPMLNDMKFFGLLEE